MSDQNAIVTPAADQVKHKDKPTEDLSSEILQKLEKLPYDRVTCRWISGNHYRCNWWAPAALIDYDNPHMDGLTVTTHRVRKSQFLTAIKTPAGLVLTGANAAARS